MRTRPGLIGRSLAAATALGFASVLVMVGVMPVRAAEGLRLQVDSTYTADPDDGVIRVRMDIRATNTTPNQVERTANGTVTTRFYFNELQFGIQPDARNIRATLGGSRLGLSSTDEDDYRAVSVRMPNLFAGTTRRIRLDFDIPGGEPRSGSDTRIGAAFATFLVWGWGDPGRSTATVVLPLGFVDNGYGEDMRRTTGSDAIEFTSGTIADPSEWYRVMIADREDALTDERIDPSGHEITVRAWPEDTAWRDEVADVLDDGVPVLVDRVGLAWPVDGTLEVTEVHSPLLEGYAGFYDPAEDAITISEDLDALTILHEASHAWFNDDLVADRWISEGLAEYFSAAVAAELGLDIEERRRTSPDAVGAFPLNDWPPPSRIDDEESQAIESFGYEASYTVMDLIVREIGEDGLRAALMSMDSSLNAYQGDGPRDEIGARSDWMRFLDHVAAEAEDGDVDDVFTRWVVAPDQRARLGERAAARATYAELESAAGTWAMPDGVRYQMGHWRFDDADELMISVQDVIGVRDDLADATEALSLTLPNDLEPFFERAESTDDLTTINTTLTARVAAVERVTAARDALAAERSILTAIGLIGVTPDAGYVAARADLEDGFADAAIRGADASLALLAGAEGIGTERAIVASIVTAALVIALTLLAFVIRRRGRADVIGVGAGTTSALVPPPIPEPPQAAETPPGTVETLPPTETPSAE